MTQDPLLRTCHEALAAVCGSSPVGLAFLAAPPAGVAHVSRPAASGCTYWAMAQQGQVFYTEAADHFGCAVGAYTHGVQLPPAGQEELSGLITTMVGLSYLKQEEVPQIPHREQPLRYLAYAPLAQMPCPPDVVLVRAAPRALMLLSEAARAAGQGDTAPVMGRPACSLVPQVMGSGHTATSLGCIGNRVYTDLPDGEAYLALPGAALPAIVEKLAVIRQANEELQKFHLKRRQAAESRPPQA